MIVAKKPDGYTSVSVYLVVDGAQRVIDLLKKTFDATELRRYDMPDGTIMHAEVRIDDTVVMIAEGGRTGARLQPALLRCRALSKRRAIPTGAAA